MNCICILALISGEGNGTPLLYSCLENPMDGGAWWAAVHGIAKSDTTEQLHFHFSLSCIGEGNGNPLRCSCLENPRDRTAWWAAISGVTQSRTRLKRLNRSSSSLNQIKTILVSYFFLNFSYLSNCSFLLLAVRLFLAYFLTQY